MDVKSAKASKIYLILYPLLFLFATLIMSVGYASIGNVKGEIVGTATAITQEDVFITDAKYVDDENADMNETKINTYIGTTLSSKIKLSEEDINSSVTYEITFYNKSTDDYMFDMVLYLYDDEFYDNENITFSISEIQKGDILKSSQYCTLRITFYYKTDTIPDNNVLNSYLYFRFIKVSNVSNSSLVGKYVEYDAGKWIEDDFAKVTSSGGTINKSTSLPTTQGQFGGYEVGSDRNKNSTPFSTSNAPKYEGWRIWNIDNDGVITLISAGHPETFYFRYGKSADCVNILTKRDYSMYVNSDYGQSARVLTGEEAVDWYNKNFPGDDYTLYENGGSNSTWYGKTFSTEEPISVLDNGSFYWLASAFNSNGLYCIYPGSRSVALGNYYSAFRYSCSGYSATWCSN